MTREEMIFKSIQESSLGLDDSFRFKCRGCGKCCKEREDILLTTRDLYKIARKLGMSMEAVIEKYCHKYIGHSSRVPITRLLPIGPAHTCPFLQDKRCAVHDSKPVVCALFPLGRYASGEKLGDPVDFSKSLTYGYLLQPIECGSVKRSQTVRQWLERFGIPTSDEFYVEWTMFTGRAGMEVRKLEDSGAPKVLLGAIWSMLYAGMYVVYNTNEELMPQFRANVEAMTHQLESLPEVCRQLGVMLNEPDEDETANSDNAPKMREKPGA